MEEQVLKEAEELERENARLKKIVPGQVLGRESLQEALKKALSQGYKRQVDERFFGKRLCLQRQACRHRPR
ncbi:hypothetical protein N9E25_07460 [Verrucomicrobiales bacterium]|nr:hypothetical protein [Verrucomicrobiales bacterium]MDC3352656.1 hypothetical protein [Verrucomicrobiales bacterium]